MLKTIIVLAVAKLKNDLCVAGIDGNGNWIRPTFLGEWRHFKKEDIYNKNDKVAIALSKVVSIRVNRYIPLLPHIEDWEYVRGDKPVLIRTLDNRERLQLFEKISEQTLKPLIKNHERTLCLIEPSSIISADFGHGSTGGSYQPRLKFLFEDNEYDFPVTCIYWRAIGRYFDHEVFAGKELQNALQYSKIFLTIGLGRLFKKKYWELVVGVHPVPNFKIEIDYDNI